MGCAIALVNLLAFFVFAVVLGLVLNSLGVIHIYYRPLGWVIPVGIVLLIFAFG